MVVVEANVSLPIGLPAAGPSPVLRHRPWKSNMTRVCAGRCFELGIPGSMKHREIERLPVAERGHPSTQAICPTLWAPPRHGPLMLLLEKINLRSPPLSRQKPPPGAPPGASGPQGTFGTPSTCAGGSRLGPSWPWRSGASLDRPPGAGGAPPCPRAEASGRTGPPGLGLGRRGTALRSAGAPVGPPRRRQPLVFSWQTPTIFPGYLKHFKRKSLWVFPVPHASSAPSDCPLDLPLIVH